MAHEKNHDYHILQPSPWPLMGALSAFILFTGSVMYFKTDWPWVMLVGFAGVFYTMYVWWSDVIHESHVGDHTPVVKIGLRYGIIMFIASEVMFFVAWFWIFFKSALYPMDQIDGIILTATQFPAAGIDTFDPWHLPLINTLILLCSGAAATWAHHAIAHENNRKDLQSGLLIAILLGVMFTVFQAYEYSHAAFGIAGNIYGGVFFMATGFHGFHVIIGTIFLTVCYLRARRGHFTPESHIGFEGAAWYWHFVDVVWLFLFISVYVWAG